MKNSISGKHLLLKAFFCIALAAGYGLALVKPIDLTPADIGRHLKNGELALHFIHHYQDPDWAPVFADTDAITFLKRNDLNADLIARFEVPKERFRVVSLKS